MGSDLPSIMSNIASQQSEGLRQRNASGNGTKVVTPTDEGKKTDQLLDKHDQWVLRYDPARSCSIVIRCEFGGPWGVVAIMTGFPTLMYYLWICLVFYDGQLVCPTSSDDIKPFLLRMWTHVREVSIYLFLLWSLA